MDITDESVLLWVAVGSAVAAVVAVALALLAISGQRRVKRAYRVFSKGGRSEDVLSLIEQHIAEVRGLRGDVAAFGERSEQLRGLMGEAITRVATMRYDAFDDMGGHLSYSTALLDERGNGVVLTSIHGRTDTRSYAKPIEAGDSPHTLSDEEAEVISRALGDDSGVAATTGGRGQGRRGQRASSDS